MKSTLAAGISDEEDNAEEVITPAAAESQKLQPPSGLHLSPERHPDGSRASANNKLT